MKLYLHPLSANSRKISALIAYLGIDVELIPVDLASGAQREEKFLKLNPNAKVPVLVDGDFVLWESNAILCYLAGKHPESKLLPTEVQERAQVERWLYWQTAHYGPALGKLIYEYGVKVMSGQGQPDMAIVEKGQAEVKQFATVLNGVLAESKFVAGELLSIADFSLGTATDLHQIIRIDLKNDYPHIAAWLGRLHEIRGWKETLPQLPEELK